jgi:tape measure domain-containing protein
MASKQVQDIKVRLGIEGFEGLDRLKGSFRELGKVTNLSDKDISRARDSLVNFAKNAGNTEQVTKGLLEALKGLQGQATRSSSAYNKLSEDIIKLNQSLKLTDSEIQKQAELLAKSARAHSQSEASIKGHVKALQDLRAQASLGGQAYIGIGAEIDRLNTKLEEGTKKSRSYRTVVGQALSGDPEKLSAQLEKLKQTLADTGNTAEQTGRAMAQLAIGGATESRARIAAFTKEIEDQRRAITRLDEAFLELPKTSAIYAQRLNELNLELNNTVIASTRYYEILADISTLQLELQRAQSIGRGQVLFERLFLPEGTASRLASTQKNLGMVIGALREEMSMLDTSTAEGSAKFAQQSRQVAQLEEQLKKLNNQYISVGQSQAAAAQTGINPYQPSGARNLLFDKEIARQAAEGVKEFRKTYNDAIDSLISAKRNFREEEARLIEQNNQQQESAHRAEMARIEAENNAAVTAFDEQLRIRANLLDAQRKAAASAMGFGGRELSPLYERITGLAGASVQREQLMMGRSATQVLTDMLTAFEKGGRGVDIAQKSTQIGESIAQGVTAGATDKGILASGANTLSEQFIFSLKKAFRIKSPSGESRDEIGVPIGQGIGQGIIQGLKEVRGDVISAVRLLFSDIAATPQRANLPAQQTALADKLQSFLARTSAKTSTFLPFARLMGEEAVSSPALTLATYRKAYERGGIVPSMYMPTEQRRNVRGVSGLPGFGLEQEIVAGAIRNVGRTGAFVGPLSGPRVSLGGARSPFAAGIGMRQPAGTPAEFQGLANALASVAKNVDVAARQIQDVGFLNLPTRTTGAQGFALNAAINQAAWQRRGATSFAGQSAPLFGASSPVPAQGSFRYGMAAAQSFPVEGMLGGGRSMQFGREAAASSTREAIVSYRQAVSNFWEGETGTFETVRRIVSSGVQLSASRLARRLTESIELPNISGIGRRIGGAMPSLSGLRAGLSNISIPGASALHELLTGDKAFMQRLERQDMAYGVSRLGEFPISGMAQIGNIGAGGGSFIPLMGGAAGGGGGRPPAAVIPPAAPSEYEKLTAAVSRFGDVNRRSTADLREFSGSLALLQDILDPTAADFKQVNQEIEKQGRLVDRELEKRQRGARRRMSGMQVAQAAGAAVSGGIFGGPEGFLGGALGGVFGGVGGAFAGAAAGAQVGMFRQQLAGFTDYAAQLQKMQIALQNAAGSQADFNQAMAAAGAATRNLNVPQDVAIQGMTKLTAAVKGAGGQVSDAEIVFKNVTSAIKATGGSAQDVDGAITAMVQVFSKGKVSAEELSGQLGERLPGAVTKFAKANDMTLPELQKALEQGQVGLNELMKFIVQLGDEYSGVAEKIASSSQDSGARLTVAFNEMRIAIGEVLQPAGAQFQEAFAGFISDITPAVVSAAKAVGEAFKFIIDNASQIGAIVEFAAKLAGVTLALRALEVMRGPIGLLFTALQSGFTATNAQAAAAQTRLIAFGTTVKTIAASVAAPIVVTFAIVGAELVIRWLQKIKKARDELRDIKTQATGEQFLKEIGGDALTQKQLSNAASSIGQEYGRVTDNVIRLRKELAQLKSVAGGPGSAALAAAPGIERVQAQLSREEAAQKLVQSRYQAIIRRLPNASTQAVGASVTQFPDLAGEAGKGKADKEAEKAAREAEKARQEMLRQLKAAQDLNFEEKNRLDLLRQEEPFAKAFTEFAIRRAEIQRKYNDLLNASKSAEERAQLEQARGAAYKQTSLTLQREINQLTEKAAAPIVETVDKIKERIAYDQEYAKLLKQGVNPELAQQLLEIKKSYEESVKALEPAVKAAEAAILKAEAEGAAATEIQKYRQELEKIQKLPGEKKKEGEEAAKRSAEEKERDRLAQEKAERLKNLYSDIVGTLEDGIVGSLMAGIDALIAGTKTLGDALKEIASGILKDIGQTLLRFAVNLGMRAAFPGAYAAKGAYFSAGQANFAENSIKPFAMGGIVTRPTFFKYAKGGEMQNGLMGEAGPEAIMPLKRGADGKLGVAAKLDGAMSRYRRSPGAAGGSAGGGATSEAAAGGTATMEPIDVRYSVERINNVEYVTADQFRAGMAQAAQQGAIQGERRAMRTLTNSAAARGRLGI